ncbi:glycosyltransferase [Nostoc sp. NMS4]|uniref:glycosyltransferase n=1 Tax=Nostoc sp. NMS4 TaxID=2815390 RepID=UPI0025D12F53|nr:glycosyltransferase [Nostoc sp. NMS4]MBN3924811.1 glycosyltransferase [Nostoc sp. NMS4]
MKKKVIFLIRNLSYGGAQRQLLTLVKGLDQQLFDITVLYFYSGDMLELDLKNSEIPLICLDKLGRWDIFGFFWRLFQHLKQIQPDILHGYLDESNLLAIFFKPFFASTQIVWGIRDSNMNLKHSDWLSRIIFRLESFLSRFADLIIANSHAGKSYYQTYGFPADKIVVIPNGIDTERFKPDTKGRTKVRLEWKISEDTILIGLVGRLHPMKDHPTFLKAAALLCKQRENMRFVCVGIGSNNYTQELLKLSNELGISEKVIWAGARTDMPEVHNALDIAVSASAYGEGFSNVIGEAMACGIPCVVTNVGDSTFLVGDAGLVVPPKDSEALLGAWLKILHLGGQKLSIMSRARIQEQFSTQSLCEKTESFLQNITI